MNTDENRVTLENENNAREKATTAIRWRKALAIVLVILGITALIGWNMKLSANLEEIKIQQDMLQGEISGVSGSVSGTMNVFMQEVQEMLKAQDSLLADYSVKEVKRDLKAGTVQYKISATPKTYQQGMDVSFLVNDGQHSLEIQGKETNHVFSATISCAFTDCISISAFLNQNSKTQIQVLEKYEGMLSESLLWADEDFWGYLVGMNLMERAASEPTYEIFINFNENYSDESKKADEVQVLNYYVLVNQKIVVSKVGEPGTQTWYGGDEEVIHGYKVDVPLDFLKNLKAGDQVVTAVLITDEYGRRYCANSAGFTVSERSEKLIIEQDDTFVNDLKFGVDFK